MGNTFLCFLLSVLVSISLPVSDGCTIDGIDNWLIAETQTVLDTFSGNIWDRSTSGIEAINTITYREGLNGGPYVDISFTDSKLVISTNDDYKNYEEIETAQTMGFTINFRCTGGTARPFVFVVNITDTNNNDPVFTPSSNYEFTLAPPLPPGFLITNCINDIIVRDIDLTTERIDFEVSGSTLFEIAFESSTVDKEFKAALRTNTLIRSISEPIVLTITATDVDRTGDPRRSATANVRIIADSEFTFPDELIFSQTFYLANYTTEQELVLQNPIYLSQGYNDQVNFSFEGQHSEYFLLDQTENAISFTVKSPIPVELYSESPIFLIVKAELQYTSGATATVVVQLPEARTLSYEKLTYEGTLKENAIDIETIVLKVGYDSDVIFSLTGDYAEHFAVNNRSNEVSLGIKEDLTAIIEDNDFLLLTLSATGTNALATSATILLQIIKEDTATPVFTQYIYEGTYSNSISIEFEEINLSQGYDDTVTFVLEGEHAQYFTITVPHPTILTLTSPIPEDLIFTEKVLVFNVRAVKPWTVGANAAIVLKFSQELTEPAVLRFTQNTYTGLLEDDTVTMENIILESGFTPETNFLLSGEYNESFKITNTSNVVTISLADTASLEELKKNRFITLEIEATRERAVSVTSTLIIEIPDIQVIVPVFENSFYTGTFAKDSGLNFTETMKLQLGFEETVTFTLEGDDAEWFSVLQDGTSVTLISNITNTVPDEVFIENDHLLFTIVAQKPGTIGGRAAIFISLLREIDETIILQFEHNSYVGSIEDGSLELDDIRMLNADVTSVELKLTGVYASLFTLSTGSGDITISLREISTDILDNNDFIILYLEASKTNAISSHTTIVLDIVKDQETQIIPPIFEQAYYVGEYSEQKGLVFLQTVRLIQGFDDTVTFELESDDSQWFALKEEGQNYLSLSIKDEDGLREILNRTHLVFSIVANRSDGKIGRTAVIISLTEDLTLIEQVTFARDFYTGYFENDTITLETIAIIQEYANDINLSLIGDYYNYFQINKTYDNLTISLVNDIPIEVIESNNILVLTLEAKTTTNRAHTTIIFEIKRDSDTCTIIDFEYPYYKGSYSKTSGLVFQSKISLIDGFDESVRFTLNGDESTWFTTSTADRNSVTLLLSEEIPASIIQKNRNLVFTIIAQNAANITSRSTIIIEVLTEVTNFTVLGFEQKSYIGSLNNTTLNLDQIILLEGYTENVTFTLNEEYKTYFTFLQEEANVTIFLIEPIPKEIIPANEIIVLELKATSPNAVSAFTVVVLDAKSTNSNATIELNFHRKYYTGHYQEIGNLSFTQTITLDDGYDETTKMELEGGSNSNANESFDKVLYNGSLENGVISHETIRLSEFTGSDIIISGEHASAFEAIETDGYVIVNLVGTAMIPESLSFIVLTLRADSANAVLVIDVAISEVTNFTILGFEQRSYIGSLNDNTLNLEQIILVEGYTEDVTFTLNEEYDTYFTFLQEKANITILLIKDIPEEMIPANKIILLELKATAPNAVAAFTVIVLDLKLTDSNATVELNFDRIYYIGHYQEIGYLNFTQTITLDDGYDETTEIELEGEHAQWFQLDQTENTATLALKTPVPDTVLSQFQPLIFLVRAQKVSSDVIARAVIIISHDFGSDNNAGESFDKILYNGSLRDGVISHETIRLSGFTGSSVIISGEHASFFEAIETNGYVIVSVLATAVIPENLSFIALTLQADSASAVLILDVISAGSDENVSESFDKVLYNGSLKDRVISHETIRLSGFTGSSIIISGEHANLFEAIEADGYVTVSVQATAVIPGNLSFIALTLQADSANAVLMLGVISSESDLPTISFGSSSYFMWIDVNQSGIVGQVQATVDNGEAVEYSLLIDDDYLQEHMSINSAGEIQLLATITTGVYNFKVAATAVTSRVSTTASVLLRVDALPECSTEDGLQPLIVLERVEEEPHLNLVVLNQTEHKDCWYTITNIWPEDQSWLYVDSEGLHARSIDREHQSIAFMILSQIQVELILHCDNDDELAIVKRSLSTGAESETDLYNYGSNRWVLADTITYNARRSVVNLIVEDINDNSPIFVGKENEPIYVGYPIPELEDTILPRALIELQATDADIGENAAVMYWTREDNLAVAPTTGYVHVRNNEQLENNSRFTAYATDQNGRGLNGSLDVVVILLDREQIAVMTVQNSFLDDENSIISNLSSSVGYDIKVLRTVIISDSNEETSRKKREIASATGASLQMFVYGIYENQPVDVQKLTSDLDEVDSVSNVRVISLEEHLEGLDTYQEQNTGLLAATIALAVLLFIIIVAVTVWFLLKWRKNRNYDKFSDANSLASRTETEITPKVESVSKPRLNIEELKKSEKRLQELLDIPVPEINVKPESYITKEEEKHEKKEEEEPSAINLKETVVNFSNDAELPIVIQSIDKLKDNNDESGEDDEFGEVKPTPRKSVVTFNENVEKIIHLEYGIDSPEPNDEVYKF